MVNVQSEFIEFHDKIKLSYNDNAQLREKRDILLRKLRDNICAEAATYTHFNQGSYAMHTGIKPDDGDYDIDVGLRFAISRSDYPDPLTVKQWVFDALDGHTKKAEIRRSCVTVTYQEDGEDAYHVDFACYADENDRLYIAKGKKNSDEDKKVWDDSDPIGLIDCMSRRFANTDEKEQFQRIIRYMKKWKNKSFETSGNSAPTGIALTTLSYHLFAPNYKINIVTGKREYDDFSALKLFVEKIKNSFSLNYDIAEGKFYHTINKICTMVSKLDNAEKQSKKSEVCSILAEIFGDEFPVKTERSYVGHSESA